MIDVYAVHDFINEADEPQLDALLEVIRRRREQLRTRRAAGLTPGAAVTLAGLSPKALNGLSGEVTRVDRGRAAVLLTRSSTDLLRWSRTRFARAIPRDLERFELEGVPAVCCVPDEER